MTKCESCRHYQGKNKLGFGMCFKLPIADENKKCDSYSPMLEEQKPIYVKEKARLGNRAIYGSFLEEHYIEIPHCSWCDKCLERDWKYCAGCGRKIDWSNKNDSSN